MKKRTYLTVAVAAASLIACAVPVQGADNNQSQAWSANAGRAGSGHIERADKLIGKSVLTPDHQKVGKINNAVVALQSGRVLYVIVDLSGGNNVAVAPGVFRQETPDSITLSVDKQKLQGAPQFTSAVDTKEQMGQASFVHNVYNYFGQNEWWVGSAPANEGSFHNVHKLSALGGMQVLDINNKPFAKVKNVMLNVHDGHVAYVVITPEASLNLGNENNNMYALPPSALTLSSDKEHLVTGITREKLASAPHFGPNDWGKLHNPTYASQIYSYYGKQAYFNNEGLKPTGR